jgi:ubiquinone/menaquinone biosynthesis C-methylase UbiE
VTRTRERLAADQFGPQAKAYVQSAVHAQGADLDELSEIARRAAPAHALDLGTGGGHVAYRLAAHAGRVTACDPSRLMLDAVAEEARARGLANLETVETAAESLPFADGAADFVASRFSAHHWSDLEAGLRQARRVLRSGAPAVFIDVCSPGMPALDTHLQAVELLRDTSHVRNYSPAEWQAALTRAGFRIQSMRAWRLRMEFAVWIARMRTPEVQSAAIRALQAAASAEVRDAFAIEPDGSFLLDAVLFEAAAA